MFLLTSLLLILGCCTVLAASGPCDLPLYCTPSQLLGCVNSIDFGNTYYKEAIDDIIKLVEPYVYLDILKNPPQPESFKNYFNPVDLIAELKKVKTEGTNFYEFFRSVQKALMSVQDGHFGFDFLGNKDFDNKITNFLVTPPLKLYTDMNNNEPGMKGALLELDLGDFYSIFANGTTTKETIERNRNNFIVSINGMSPFDFVLNYGSEYYNNLKNKDAKYTYASKVISERNYLYYFPMLEKDFTNFTVVYSNGESFTSDFYFFYFGGRGSKERSDIGNLTDLVRELLKNHDGRKTIGIRDIIKAYNNGEKPDVKRTVTEIEVIEALRSYDFEKELKAVTEKKTNQNETLITANAITWEHSTSDKVLKCRVDNKNKIDVFFIQSTFL